jgi:hypothetical protein
MSYERNLTFNLRIRGLSEAEIAETLAEVRAHVDAAGTPPEAEFGTAEEYAKQFPWRKRRTLGHTVTMVGVVLAVAYLLLGLLLMLAFRVDIREVMGPLTLLQAAGVALVSLLAGFLTDYFQPVQESRAT